MMSKDFKVMKYATQKSMFPFIYASSKKTIGHIFVCVEKKQTKNIYAEIEKASVSVSSLAESHDGDGIA